MGSRYNSYYSPSSDPDGRHPKLIFDAAWTKCFVVAADMSAQSGLHKAYTRVIQAFLMVITPALNMGEAANKYMVQSSKDFVQEVRRQLGVTALHHEGINAAIPVKQGYPSDKRFDHQRCGNPLANCPVTKGSFKPLTSGRVLDLDCRVCMACWIYHYRTGIHRPQNLVDVAWNIAQRKAATAHVDPNWCGWCHFSIDYSFWRNKVFVAELGITICLDCRAKWETSKRLRPIAGLHYPIDHCFACGQCQATTSPVWKLTADGRLFCAACVVLQKNLFAWSSRKKVSDRIATDPASQLDYAGLQGGWNSVNFTEHLFVEFGTDLRTTEACKSWLREHQRNLGIACTLPDEDLNSNTATPGTGTGSKLTAATSVTPVAGPSRPKLKPKSKKQKASSPRPAVNHDDEDDSDEVVSSRRAGKRRARSPSFVVPDDDEVEFVSSRRAGKRRAETPPVVVAKDDDSDDSDEIISSRRAVKRRARSPSLVVIDDDEDEAVSSRRAGKRRVETPPAADGDEDEDEDDFALTWEYKPRATKSGRGR